MMKVTIDIVPLGKDEDTYTIEEIFIWNMTQKDEHGYTRYHYKQHTRPVDSWDNDGVVWHLREDGAFGLVEKVIHSMEEI